MPSDLSLQHSPSPEDITVDDRRLLAAIRDRFKDLVSAATPLFTTDAVDQWPRFLSRLPEPTRATYQCNACRHFVERFGGLVVINRDGSLASAIWSPAYLTPSSPFFTAVSGLEYHATTGKVTGVFLTSKETLGTPVTGPWNHFAVHMPAGKAFRSWVGKNAAQVMAEKHEERNMLARSLAEFPLVDVRTAVNILRNGAGLYRGEKVLSVAEWLLGIHSGLEGVKNRQHRANLIWKAAASAPPGFAHVRASMIGTLLEDIGAGLSAAAIAERFAARMNPLQYQRPTAAPSAGQIAAAEAAVAKLEAEGALERRFARIEDIQEFTWLPSPEAYRAKVAGAGIFAHLLEESRPRPRDVEPPAAIITWEKFRRTVLPHALELEVNLPSNHVRLPFIALVTAARPEAPPILQWDALERRNPVSWYVYQNGSTPLEFNLEPGWVAVTGITPLPSSWGGTPREQWGDGAVLLLKGARDEMSRGLNATRDARSRGGMGFFPEILRAEFHPYRKTLEAYARAATLTELDQRTVAGLDLRKGSTWNVVVRATTALGRASYRLERWD